MKQAIAFLALLHLPLAALQAADSPASKPNIDSIAVRGVRFTDAYANGSFCTPTRAALMSCRYQHRFGIEDLGGPLPAQHAQREGYRRGKLGKGSTVCCNSRWTVINHRLVLQFGSRFRMH